jgi:hypothetical protein
MKINLQKVQKVQVVCPPQKKKKKKGSCRARERESVLQSYLDVESMPQGLKNFNKAARELISSLQKIDGDNYPEVTPFWFVVYVPCIYTEDNRTIDAMWIFVFTADFESDVHHQCWFWI